MIIKICESENTVTLDNGFKKYYWYSRIENIHEVLYFYRGRSKKPFMTVPINYCIIIYSDEE